MWAGGWTDGQTDIMKLIVAFRNSANAPSNCTWTGRVPRGAGGRGGGEKLRGLPERHSPSGGKINILNKIKDFLC